MRLLEKVEYRRADSPADKAAIYRLRHDAYMRAGTVEPKASGLFHDPMDETDNAWLIGVFIDGTLASALRLHISASLRAPLPELASFPDLVAPHLAAGRNSHRRFAFRKQPGILPAILRNSVYYAQANVSCRGVFRRRLYHCGVSCGAPSLLPPDLWGSDMVSPETISTLQAFNGLGGV